MNQVLARWNSLDPEAAAATVLPCCGSSAWAAQLAAARPIEDPATLLNISSAIWLALPQSDWIEAFNSHPRIGETKPQTHATAQSLQSSTHEQATAAAADDAIKLQLRAANLRYEQRFGRIFLVCASGKTATEILTFLERRMSNDDTTEMHEAAEQQRQITALRLQRWLETT